MIDVELTTLGEISIEMNDPDFPAFTVGYLSDFELEVSMQLVGERGPQGIQGPPGDVSASSVGQLSDVELANLQDGDTLLFSQSVAKFVNVHKATLTDGGNF